MREKQYNNGKLPSNRRKGSFWWRDVLKLLQNFKTFTTIQVQIGNTCLFWTDSWIQQPLQLEYPQLYSFARNKEITINSFYAQQNLLDLFNLPLSIEAYNQSQEVQSFIDHFQLIDQQDIWSPARGEYSVSKTYKLLIRNRNSHQIFKWLWECFFQPKHKVFF